MKISYKQYSEFSAVANAYLAQVVTEPDDKNKLEKPITGKDTKLGYAIQRVFKLNKDADEDYRAKVQDLRADYAATEKGTGVILTEPNGNFKFTPKGLKDCNAKLRDLVKEQANIETYIATVVPDNLTDEQKEAFAGIVIPEIEEKTEPQNTAPAEPASDVQ